MSLQVPKKAFQYPSQFRMKAYPKPLASQVREGSQTISNAFFFFKERVVRGATGFPDSSHVEVSRSKFQRISYDSCDPEPSQNPLRMMKASVLQLPNAGMSDFGFTQGPDNCLINDWSCP